MRIVLLSLLLLAPLGAQERSGGSSGQADLGTVGKIKTEAFENSQLMDTLWALTDEYGPRLTASPEFREAAQWTVKRLQGYGLENVHLENWRFGRSWELKHYSVEMLAPRYASLVAAPLAWSDGTHGAVSGDVMLTPFGSGRRTFSPKTLQDDLDNFKTAWHGKLKGKIVLLAAAREVAPVNNPPFTRDTEKELGELYQAPPATVKVPVDPKNLKFPDDPDELRRYVSSLPAAMRDSLFDQREAILADRAKWMKEEGVAAIVNSDPYGRAKDGLLFAEAAGSYKAKDTLAPPTFVVTQEQYNRMARLVEKKVPVKVRVNLEVSYSKGDEDSWNIVGEIPGGAKKDEVVMIGAHFDSWHTGTGATDNGAGSATMIEAMRILKTLNLKLDRTVRIALWSGEEEGLLGSKAYVKAHFGDPDTMKLLPEHEKLAGYFNLDNGSGKIRGVYLQGNDAMRPVFDSWLAPFRDEGVSTMTIRNTGGTDHLSFDAVGLPGFQFVQDPLDYSTLTHHSDMDTFDHIQGPDLMQAAAIVATVVYDAANRPEMLPRKELPKARKPADTMPGTTSTP